MKTKERICRFIMAYMQENGFAPSTRDIMKGVGLRSTSTAYGHIIRLERAGYITRREGLPRAMCITDKMRAEYC